MKQPAWITDPPSSLIDKVRLIKDKQSLMSSPGSKGRFLRNLLKEVEQQHSMMMEQAERMDPLAFFHPSYEQSLVLNSWMYGISFVCIYCANRIGKTTACIVNIMLWIFPNNPKWQIFKPYIVGDPIDDPLNQNNPNRGARVQVFQRPDISALKKIADALKRRPAHLPVPNPRKPHYDPDNLLILQWLQKEVPSAYSASYPDAPWNVGGTIWFGAPDQDHHEQVMFPLWKYYLPISSQDRYVPSEREISIKVVSPTGRTTAWELIGKSYESKDTKWSSGAVDIIMLTEGVKPATLKEVKLRFKDPGIGSHDFTPYEPANAGAASALAQRIARGAEKLPLRNFVFTEFSVYDAPAHIISDDKRNGLIESCKDDPEAVARLEGKFFTSSLLILANLSRTNNLLPWSIEEMFERYPTGRIYRGLDPGLDHPTACAWGLLLPTNQWIIYRIFAKSGLPIQSRCEKIIKLSNNAIAKVKWGPGDSDFYCVETHPSSKSEIVCATSCDYHTFKKDEVTDQSYALNYQLAGLNIIESIHMRPEERGQSLDNALLPNQFIPDLRTGVPAGPRVYFLQNSPGIMETFLKWEEFYWERKRSGDDKGAPKDKMPLHGDDELDAVTYLTASPFRWTSWRPSARFESDSEPEDHLASSAQTVQRRSTFATIAKEAAAAAGSNREVRFFGQQEE